MRQTNRTCVEQLIPTTLPVLLTIALSLVAATAQAQALQSNHGQLQAVPVVTAPVIDGKFDEWDTSAEIFSYGVRKLRDRYSVRIAAMWDAEALYLGLRWRDPTPMINNVDVDASPGDAWMADSFQGRFVVGGRQVHLTTCYSSKKDKTSAVFEYDVAPNPNGRRVFLTPGKNTHDPSGFAQAFVADRDARGYAQELRIPWKLLSESYQPTAGETLTFTGEYFWGNASGTTWPAVMWSDPINQENPVRIVIYQNPAVWGQLELLAQGNLPPRPSEEDAPLLQGPVKLRFEVPAEAAYFSVVIDDADGRRVRNLAAHLAVKDYLAPAGASSPQNLAAGTKRIEIPWDGRPDGEWNKQRTLFVGEEPVPAGSYTARCLVHQGIGVEFAGSFYNPGNPPWPTGDGRGGWGFDHSNPQAVAAIPKEAPAQGRVFLGWAHGECGVGFIGLDAEGHKLWEWLRRGTGATHLATTAEYVYFTFESEGHRLGRVHPDKGDQVAFDGGALEIVLPGVPTGLAVRATTLAVAFAEKNLVVIFDAQSGAKQREISIDAPGSLTLTPAGDLLGISGQELFVVKPGATEAQRLDMPGQPLAVASDSAGRVYVSDRARSVVAQYDGVPNSAATAARTLGEPGGHVPGPWNPRRIGNPTALAIEERADGATRLWVTENQLAPRRVSVWDVAQQSLVRDYLGNTRYCASGGFLSDDLPTDGFVDGVRYALDYARGTYQPVEILGGSPPESAGEVNAFPLGKGAANFGNPVHFFSNVSGVEREYIVEAGGTHPMVFMKRGDRWRCVTALGAAAHTLPAELPRAPSGTSAFSWHDADDDGHQQPEEMRWHDFGIEGLLHTGWGYRCGRDLVFYHSGFAFRPLRFTADGAPVYDVTQAERLPGELGQVRGDIHRTNFGYVADVSQGQVVDKNNVIHGLHHLTGFDTGGRRRWTYPSYWIAVHGAFSAPMAMPGVLMGMLKVTGVIEPAANGEHSVIAVRGNIGQEFLIRDDGLYLAELFTDQRMAPADLPPTREIVGAPINETTLGGEPFNGWSGRQRDGKVRMTYGLTDVRIAEVVGLDRAAELPPQSVQFGTAELAAARAFQPQTSGDQLPTRYEVPRGGAFAADGKLFADASTVLILRSGREEVGRARLRWDEQGLHLACLVADTTPFVNKGLTPQLAFKTGDSVSLFLAPAEAGAEKTLAGTRVLLAALQGKATAVVYRPQGPGDAPFVFESPVRKSPFAFVAEDPSVNLTVTPETGSYTLLASIPWQTLAITPRSGATLRGDMGFLFADDTGSNTAQRVHWVDRETNVVNDIPTEAEFFPAQWGIFVLVEQEDNGR